MIIANPEWNSEYGANSYNPRDRSGGNSSPAYAYFTSSTNVAVISDDLDMFDGYSYGTITGTYYGSVIEYEL